MMFGTVVKTPIARNATRRAFHNISWRLSGHVDVHGRGVQTNPPPPLPVTTVLRDRLQITGGFCRCRPTPQDLTTAAATAENLTQELVRSRTLEAEARREAAAAAATAASEAAAATKAASKTDLDAVLAREKCALDQLRKVEKNAAQAREASARELEEAREACVELRAKAKSIQEDARVELRRGRAKLAELVEQKDDMVGS